MPIERILRRSEELDNAIVQLLDLDAYQPFDDSPRIGLSVSAASLSIDHARALRLLAAAVRREGRLDGGVTPREAMARAIVAARYGSDVPDER